MSAILESDVLSYAPELASLDAGAWTLILAFVNELQATAMTPAGEGPLLKLARILLAAHYGTISRRGPSGATGPVTSEAAGAVRRSYGLVALASSDASLGATGYGQQFLGVLSMSLANGPRLA